MVATDNHRIQINIYEIVQQLDLHHKCNIPKDDIEEILDRKDNFESIVNDIL